MNPTLRSFPLGDVKLLPGMFQQRYDLNRRYMMSLQDEQLLQNYYLEAGLVQASFRARLLGEPGAGDDWCWGWESPTCQLRGHFLGHWLSAAARMWASNSDQEVKAKADTIVAELARCQRENGGEWAASIPEKYLEWTAHGKKIWAPHYTIHKTLMGLFDMYAYAGSAQALDVLESFAHWFSRWSARFSREEMNDILDVETGGMLETWADLYGATGKQEYLELFQRYERPRLFDRLLAGEDPLTHRHANTTIPEIHGVARMYEVTGEERLRKIVEAYWNCAVDARGTFCTGGQTSAEMWTPPHEYASLLGQRNQEHCVVYNMIRLADFLLRWTGEARFGDYIERNLYNGILAQQNRETGMVCYFLPLGPGSTKLWGSPTYDFWCCHGTMVQAQTTHNAYTYYQDAEGLLVSQYIPSQLTWGRPDAPVSVTQSFDPEISNSKVHLPDCPMHRPDGHWTIDFQMACEQPAEFTLKLRMPEWLAETARVWVNGQAVEAQAANGYLAVRRAWQHDVLRLVLPKKIAACPLPDQPGTVAFLDGPVVLAGLCDGERALHVHGQPAESLLVPDDTRDWGDWKPGYRACNQERGLRFIPLHDVVDEPYTVYFPIV